MYTLRQATNDDYEFLYSLIVASLKEYVAATWGWDDAVQEQLFQSKFDATQWQIAVVDATDIGAVAVAREAERLVLGSIYILPQHQRRGVGTAIIQNILEDARRQGLPVVLQVLQVNAHARMLYERLGFEIVGETETHFLMRAEPPTEPPRSFA